MAKQTGKMKARQRQSQRQHAARTAVKPAKSTHQPQELWRFPDRRADKIALIESFDRFADARKNLRAMAAGFSEYAGIPLPIDGEQMVIEPSYGFSEVFNKPRQASENEEESYPGYTVRNEFWSTRWRCLIVVFRAPDGKIRHGKIPGMHHIAYDLHTMGCSVAWGVEQESRALQLLGTMLPHHQFKYYLLTGMFMERSPRSGLTYIFRKLRPTVVLDARDVTSKADTRILCTLCMHPIGYYAGSWAGAMCPTDDVIAHLSLMRGDEPMFWRRSNQHHPERAEAGL